MKDIKALAFQRKRLFIRSVIKENELLTYKSYYNWTLQKKHVTGINDAFYPHPHETAYLELDSLAETI